MGKEVLPKYRDYTCFLAFANTLKHYLINYHGQNNRKRDRNSR